MENTWLKEKVKKELEVDYKQKLDEVVAKYEKMSEQGFEEAWKIVQELQAKLKEEQDKNKTMEVKFYEEYEKKCKDQRDYLVSAIDRYMASPEYKHMHGLTGKDIIEEAIKHNEKH